MKEDTKGKPKDESGVFQVSETADGASPSLMSTNKDRPTDPEWHMQNIEKPAVGKGNSLIEVDLNDQPPVSLATEDPPVTDPTEGKSGPTPVDLTSGTSPDAATKPATHFGKPRRPSSAELSTRASLPSSSPPSPPPSLWGKGKDAQATTGGVDPSSSVEIPVDETAFERDLRRRSSNADSPADRSITSPDQPQMAGPAGLAFTDGKSIHLPVGLHPQAGEVVEYNGRRYRLKARSGYSLLFYLRIAGLLVLTILAAVGVSSFFSAPQPGTLGGVIVDASNGRILPDALITLSDGTTTRANIAGMYAFAGLTPGDYQITASLAGYSDQSRKASRSSEEYLAVPFVLEPLFTATPEQEPKKTTPVRTEKQPQASKYGALELAVDFNNFIIFLDGKIIGKNIKKLSKISPGEHKLTLEKNQYEEYRTQIKIRAHKTTTLAVSLSDLKRKTTPRQRARKHFAEGKQALDAGLYSGAVSAFDAALAELPEYPEALQYRGWVQRKQGAQKKAITDLQAAAELYALANRYLEAINCVNLLVEIEEKNGTFYVRRGDYHTALAEMKKAIEDYQSAVKTDKGSLSFRLALAEAYYLDQQFKEAAKTFEKARRMTDDPTDVYVRLILAYMYAGKDKDLIKRYREMAAVATEEKMELLRRDPEWQRVLQLVGPEERFKNP